MGPNFKFNRSVYQAGYRVGMPWSTGGIAYYVLTFLVSSVIYDNHRNL